MQAEHLIVYDKALLEHYIGKRKGETKLGEKLQLADSSENWQQALMDSDARFVLLGLPEDIGIRGNLGKRGSVRAWEHFLKAFSNIQSNRFLSGESILLLGHINFTPLLEKVDALSTTSTADVEQFRQLTEQVDEWVYPIVETIVTAGKIPIVIGGGHNNAFGCIKGTSIGLNTSLNVVNLDPHADYRALEGRHSGNGFSYAKAQGYLNQYSILGLHEGYNAESMLQELDKDNDLSYHTFEALFIREEEKLSEVLATLSSSSTHPYWAIEIDLDSIAQMPVSAYTPSGITVEQARKFVHQAANNLSCKYLHLAEGAPLENNPQSGIHVGKTLAYLVSDFVKACL
tara:strand:+ start:1109 stop:2140 length:1032 start_codon:yes stop_codon:yes gene_type:complete